MNKLTKGALAMVLAGSVTFSVANALLAEQPLKRLAKEIALPISGAPKKADVISQAEKTMKEQTPTTIVKDSYKQVAYKNKNMSVIAIKANKQNTKKLSKSTTTNSASKNEAPTTTIASKSTGSNTKSKVPTTVATTKPVTSSKAPTTTKPATSAKPPTTTTVTKPTGSNPKSNTKTITNRGQQVSQAAKERAEIRKNNKETNGKKM